MKEMSEASAILKELGDLVQRAGRLAQESRAQMDSRLKVDGSIVTAADVKVEEFLRKELAQLLPGSSVWGEELGWDAPGESGSWAVDPIDGTSNFSYGGLIWGVTVGLMKNEDCVLGAIYLPDIDELYLAEQGRGATLNGTAIPPIPPGPIQDHELVSFDDVLIKRFPKTKVPGKMRCYGAFVADAMFTATQRFRGMIGRREKLYDIAASVCILREVGAEIRYADGSPFSLSPLCGGEKIKKPWLMFPQQNGFYL